MSFLIPVLLLLCSICGGILSTANCPQYNRLTESLMQEPGEYYIVYFWDKKQSLADPYPHKTVRMVYYSHSGLYIGVESAISDNLCKSELLRFYSFFLDYEPVVEDRCSIHRKYPPNYILRLSEDHQFCVMIGCTHHGDAIHYEVFVLSTRSKGNSTEEVLIAGKKLLELEGLSGVELVPIAEATAFNSRKIPMGGPKDCHLNCSTPFNYNSFGHMRAQYDPGLAKQKKKPNTIQPQQQHISYIFWRISVVGSLVVCVVCLHIFKRFRQRNRINVAT